MNIAKQIARNTLLLGIAMFANNLMAFFWTVYAVRYLSAGDYGILNTALSMGGILVVFADLGVNTYIVREVSRDHRTSSEYLTTASVIKFVLSILTVIILYFIILVRDYNQVNTLVTLIIGIYLIFDSFSTMFYSFFQAYGKMEYHTIGLTINSIIILVGVILSTQFNGNVITISASYLIAGIVTSVYSAIIMLKRFSRPKHKLKWCFIKKTIKEALPFGMTNIFNKIYYMLDTVMLSILVNDVVVAWYTAAYKLVLVMSSIYNIYMWSIFPVMSKIFVNEKDALKLTFQRSIKYVLILTIPIATGTTFLASDIILLITGNQFYEYSASILTLQILIWSIVFMFVNGVTINLLGSMNKQVTVTKISGIGAFMNITMNLILIPSYSLFGASVATVLTELIMMVLLAYTIYELKYGFSKELLKHLIRVLIANFLMILVLVYSNFSFIPMILVSMLVYGIGIIITNAFDKKDQNMVRGLFKR